MNENLTPEMQAFVDAVEKTMLKVRFAYEAEVNKIISDKVTDIPRIESIFDLLWIFIDDEEIHKLFWRLINYVETFDTGVGAFYRRIEEVHFEGY